MRKERDIKGLIGFYHQIKPLDGLNQEEAIISRHNALVELLKYLPYIPIGHSDRYRTNDPKGRLRLFEERGKRCEICCSDLTDKPFELHHLNYFKPEDPQYQKILCPPCHESIRYVHGLVKIFEDKLANSVASPLSETEFIRMRRTTHIEDVDEE